MFYNGDALEVLKGFDENSVDTCITDPPYGYSFMNKDWDKAVIGVETWKEVLRVVKPGSFAAIMSSPRQDVLAKMIINLQAAGFRTDFTSIYWTYASGFPKAANVSKLVDKRGAFNMSYFGQIIKQRRIELGLSMKDIAKHFPSETGGITGCVWNWENGDNCPTVKEYNKLVDILKLDKLLYPELHEAEREIIKKGSAGFGKSGKPALHGGYKEDYNITKSTTEKAKSLDGSYAGFQPKPSVEVILMVMKPLSEKTFVDQALANGKGITWLDSVRIPFDKGTDTQPRIRDGKICNDIGQDSIYGKYNAKESEYFNQKGRFPANLLVEDDVLNDGSTHKSGNLESHHNFTSKKTDNVYGKYIRNEKPFKGDSGSYSRYFDLDRWFSTTFPFIITPKASSAEKNRGLDAWMPPSKVNDGRNTPIDNPFQRGETLRVNIHPTVKPIKLMCYLVSLLARKGDTVLDPFIGSGTTLIAAKMLGREWIGIDINKEYIDIANARLSAIEV